jgi:transposase
METTLLMSTKERVRLEVLSRVVRREISVGKAAGLMGLSERQARRVWRRYRVEGDRGLVHRLRGRPGNAGRGDLRQKALSLCRGLYSDFGSALAVEYLAKEGLEVPRQTLWRWRRQAGDLQPKRRVARHRIRRERRGCLGELVQMDGSAHDWFEGRRSPCVVFVMIDDASGKVFGRFYESEDTASAFDLLGCYVRKRGLPMALYVDKDSIGSTTRRPGKKACKGVVSRCRSSGGR